MKSMKLYIKLMLAAFVAMYVTRYVLPSCTTVEGIVSVLSAVTGMGASSPASEMVTAVSFSM